MNRRKFLKLFGGLLLALPFVKWFAPDQLEPLEFTDNADIISYDTFADAAYIVCFNMTDEEVKETKAKWQKFLDNQEQERGYFYRTATE